MKPVRDPENYCPICGQRRKGAHRCSPAFLKRRDTAMEIAERVPQQGRTFNQRLTYARLLTGLAGDDHESRPYRTGPDGDIIQPKEE